MASANINATTRELFLSTVKDSVFLRMALFTRMSEMRRITVVEGQNIQAPVDMAEMTALGQSYSVNDPLTAGSMTMLSLPKFYWKYHQVPLSYTVEEKIMNGGSNQTQVVDFVKFLVKKGQRASRLCLNKMMFAPSAGNTSDTDDTFQSIPDALTHDATYGTKTRATTVTNSWWQGASVSQGFADQATALAPTLANFRTLVGAIDLNGGGKKGLLAICGTSNYQRLQAQCEAQTIYKPGPLARYGTGFNSMIIDGIEIVEEPYLEQRASNPAYATSKNYFFILNLEDWELRLHPERAFHWEDFTYQGMVPNGTDSWLARIMLAGNLVCWRPAGSIFRSDVS